MGQSHAAALEFIVGDWEDPGTQIFGTPRRVWSGLIRKRPGEFPELWRILPRDLRT